MGMRKISLGIFGGLFCIATALAAVRTDSVPTRAGQTATRGASSAAVSTRAPAQGTTSRGGTSGASQVVSRSTTASSTGTKRGEAAKSVASRVARAIDTLTTSARSARATRVTVPGTRTASGSTAARSATTNAARTVRHATASSVPSVSRAALSRSATAPTVETLTFGTGYNTCRDAYFACMDQFCAMQNETYRRCVCSSRLQDIKNHERVLSQTGDSLQNFKDLNLEVISKTPAEVAAMFKPTEGETLAAEASTESSDKSGSASALAGISDVLNQSKKKSLSTQGQVDIAGDINAIWSTTDLAAGTSLANLTGEALYNAVHAQCAELIAPSCESTATFNMVVSAYGMYIENDCTQLASTLSKQTIEASSQIRATEREMNQARLENYNTHNSSEINDCIANVRKDLTGNMACGEDYVHCIDITGMYLDNSTGAPIYTADFYQLENQLSMSGDLLTNETNMALVAELNRKKTFAEKSLDACRDVADEVWDEFMRQAITEIYQSQQERVRQVKNECLSVVNQCYDEQSNSLKDFSNIKEQVLLGQRLELSEELCRVKLDACSNLYGGGPGGMALLGTMMAGITDQKIAKECKNTLTEFAHDICRVSVNDNVHGYPYGCRAYTPGDIQGALILNCTNTSVASNEDEFTPEEPMDFPYMCLLKRIYKSCKPNYYLCDDQKEYASTGATDCCLCSEYGDGRHTCSGGTERPHQIGENDVPQCPTGYVGSVYQKLARYALQVCIRPSVNETGKDLLPNVVLQDVNMVMDSIRVDMANQLSAECERQGGTWVNKPQRDKKTAPEKHLTKFYDSTGTNLEWGYCREKDVTESAATSSDTPSTPTTP